MGERGQAGQAGPAGPAGPSGPSSDSGTDEALQTPAVTRNSFPESWIWSEISLGYIPTLQLIASGFPSQSSFLNRTFSLFAYTHDAENEDSLINRARMAPSFMKHAEL